MYAKPDLKYEQEQKIVQFISWEAQEDVLYYELVIEKDTGGGKFTPAFKQTTEETVLKTSLPAGRYRYRVNVWDLLGRQRPPASWSELVVIKALKPQIQKAEPDKINLEKASPYEITLSGSGFDSKAEVSLLSAGGIKVSAVKVSVDGGGEEAEARFNASGLEAGVYSIVIENPGGLSDSLSNFIVAYGEELSFSGGGGGARHWEGGVRGDNFTFSLGYNPFIPVMGELARSRYYSKSTLQEEDRINWFDSIWYPAGIDLNFSWYPFKRKEGSLGAEICASWAYIDNNESRPAWGLVWDEKSKEYILGQVQVEETEEHFFQFIASVCYQSPIFFNRLAINIKAGGGMIFVYGLRVHMQALLANGNSAEEVLSGKAMALMPVIHAELSFDIFLRPNFFLRAGTMAAYSFPKYFPQKGIVVLLPLFNIGWNF